MTAIEEIMKTINAEIERQRFAESQLELIASLLDDLKHDLVVGRGNLVATRVAIAALADRPTFQVIKNLSTTPGQFAKSDGRD